MYQTRAPPFAAMLHPFRAAFSEGRNKKAKGEALDTPRDTPHIGALKGCNISSHLLHGWKH